MKNEIMFGRNVLGANIILEMINEELDHLQELSQGDNSNLYFINYYETKGMIEMIKFANLVSDDVAMNLDKKLYNIHINRGKGV